MLGTGRSSDQNNAHLGNWLWSFVCEVTCKKFAMFHDRG